MITTAKEIPLNLAVLDDEDDVVEGLQRRLTRAGFKVKRIIPRSPGLSDMISEVMSVCDACLCDHDLRGGHQVDFSGAELVAALTEQHFPSILFTGVLPAQRYAIRRNMARIPAFLPRDDLTAIRIAHALEESVGEVKEGRRPARRRGRRTPVTILNSRKTGTEELVEGLVAGWPGSDPIQIPADLLASPWSADPSKAVGRTFFATINIGEGDPDQLFFEAFEQEPAEIDELLESEH